MTLGIKDESGRLPYYLLSLVVTLGFWAWNDTHRRIAALEESSQAIAIELAESRGARVIDRIENLRSEIVSLGARIDDLAKGRRR